MKMLRIWHEFKYCFFKGKNSNVMLLSCLRATSTLQSSHQAKCRLCVLPLCIPVLISSILDEGILISYLSYMLVLKSFFFSFSAPLVLKRKHWLKLGCKFLLVGQGKLSFVINTKTKFFWIFPTVSFPYLRHNKKRKLSKYLIIPCLECNYVNKSYSEFPTRTLRSTHFLVKASGQVKKPLRKLE